MENQLIEIRKLVKSPKNARRTVVKGASEELKSSLLAHGLLHNLVVTAAGRGKYRVIAGSRRLEALKALQAEGKLPDSHAVPCQIVDEVLATEMSLAENTVRLAMHPADEFEAFARLAEEGYASAAIAERFGVPERHVLQRLKLGRAAPELLEAYRAGELTLESLTAFTLTDDREKQLQVFATLKELRRLHPRDIRAALTETMMEAGSRLAAFVGLDVYRAAGGTTRTDLFGEDIYLEQPELVHRLAGEKLDAIRRKLEAEGWLWVEISPEREWEFVSACGRLRPQPVGVPQALLDEKAEAEAELAAIECALEDSESDALIDAQETAEARLSEIGQQIAAFAAYDPEQIGIAGCYVSVDHDGRVRVEKGLVRRQEMKRLAHGEEVAERKPKGMPDTLRRDLEAYRLQAAQAEIATHPAIALDLLVFTVARALFGGTVSTGPDVQFRQHRPMVRESTLAGDALKAVAAGLPLAWLEPEGEAEQFRLLGTLPQADKLNLLAYCVAVTLKPQLATGHEATACEHALARLGASVAGYWRPAKGNYLGRITRERLLAIGRETLGEQWSQAWSREKRGELAARLERAFAEPEKHARTPEQCERLNRWLPEGMAFGMLAAAPSEAEEAGKAA